MLDIEKGRSAEGFGEQLAKKLEVSGERSTRGLRRLAGRQLSGIREVYREAAQACAEGGRPSIPVEWLLDNYYVCESEAKGALRELSHIRRLMSTGRRDCGGIAMFALARGLCIYCDNLVTTERIEGFLTGVYRVLEPGSAELWAFPTLLRLALVSRVYDVAVSLRRGERDEESDEAAAASLGNAMRTLKFLATYDYADCFERVSGVEALLQRDPSGVYPRMEERSKAYYRSRVIRMSRSEGISEEAVARHALEQALLGRDEKTRHVGYYLLEEEQTHAAAGKWYFFFLLFLPAAVVLPLFFWLKNLLPILLLFPVFEITRNLVHTVAERAVPPRFVPRMDLKDGIPVGAETLCVISCLLTSPKKAEEFAKRLERFYLANREERLCMGLLADLKESETPETPADAALIGAAREAVAALNRKYGGGRFFLLLRSRRLGPDGKYMGWERKRGALLELVRFIGGGECSISALEGDKLRLPRTKYVITLDADTNLGIDDAREMTAALLHPMNRPEYDDLGVVRSGYGLLQPRIGLDLISANASAFSKIMVGHGGIDSYTNAVCDVYQDVFGEGIFTGKGIFSVEAFSKALDRALPENRILSHDLLEGSYLRAGLITDVELTDGFPSSFASYIDRHHRWVRGDWQLLPYLLPAVKNSDGESVKNPLNGLSRWKIADNLRRSLTPVAAVAAVYLSLLLDGKSQAIAVLALLLSVFSGLLISVAGTFLSGSPSIFGRRYHSTIITGIKGGIYRSLLHICIYLHLARVTADAVGRTLWRLLVSKKKLLSWVTAEESERINKNSVAAYLRRMWPDALIGALTAALAPCVAVRILGILWALSFAAAWALSRPERSGPPSVSAEDRKLMLQVCRDSWGYFRDFMNPEHNFLPPDNYQETPLGVAAPRTSPTNMGVALLCCVSARDLGFIDSGELADRVEKMLSTIDRMEKWKGHLYNWYNTRDLSLLRPAYVSAVDSGNFAACLIALRQGLMEYESEAPAATGLIERIGELLEGMRFDIFYNEKRGLFHIGYDAETGALGDGYYDLYMSEARTVSYIAAARREVPRKHYFKLGRTLVKSDGYVGLASWTGTMFEYFMPHILMPVYENSLVYEALRFALFCQRRRAARAGVPWGISESGFYSFDSALNYQYKAFGVQKLGLKRGLNRELVVSPYSTCLTSAMAPAASVKNLRRLRELGAYGRYGFYEAIDYNNERSGGMAIVRSFMAHHLGMSLLMLTNALKDNIMQKRFMADSQMGSAVELLQERIPVGAVVYEDVQIREAPSRERRPRPEGGTITLKGCDVRRLRGQMLSNGTYGVLLTDAGLGFSLWKGRLMNRFRDDPENPKGIFMLCREGGRTFSLTPAPLYHPRVEYAARLTPHLTAFSAELAGLSCETTVTVHGTLPVEQREVRLCNTSSYEREAQLLLYFEPTLMSEADETAHPAFSNLFIESEYDEQSSTLFFRRRLREKAGELVMAIRVTGEARDLRFETFRERAVLRGETAGELAALFDRELRGSTGACIDPAAILRVSVRVGEKSAQSAGFLLCAGDTKEQCLLTLSAASELGLNGMLQSSRECARSQRAATLIGEEDDETLASLTPALYFSGDREQALLASERENTGGQSALWKYGVSGDEPVILLEVEKSENVFELLPYVRMHRYLSLKGVRSDLVIAFSEGGDYTRPIFGAVKDVVRQAGSVHLIGARGGVHLLNLQSADPQDIHLLRAVCRYWKRAGEEPETLACHPPVPLLPPKPLTAPSEKQPYEVTVKEGEVTLRGRGTSGAPWFWIFANRRFGSMVSDRGMCFSFSDNARELRLSRWTNDPLWESGERLRLKLDGAVWDLCAAARTVRYEPGAAIYEFEENGLRVMTRCFVPDKYAVKVVELTLENELEQEREISAVYSVDAVLGVSSRTSRHLKTDFADGILRFTNPFNTAYPGRIGYLAAEGGVPADTAMVDAAADMPSREGGAGLAVKRHLPGRRREKIVFILGAAVSERELSLVMGRVLRGDPDALCGEAARVLREFLGKLRISTPDPAIDEMVNFFSPYQTLMARIRGRTGFYQCSGAYGYRDQLQDCLSLILRDPEIARLHLIRCAAHQFVEGDVQHWWHNLPVERGMGHPGVRTRCSDDLLWLPFGVCEYVEKTGDQSLWDVPVHYIEGRPLSPRDREVYFIPRRSSVRESVYDHCRRAIERGDTRGAHGLPLIGSGDWNDGMNRVGDDKQGESVWLGWFLSLVMLRFSPVARERGDTELADRLEARARELVRIIEEHCWDGDWYLRGYYANGATLGSHKDEECQIDSIAQSFAALLGKGEPGRSKKAMDAVWERLYNKEKGYIKLFTPAFVKGKQDPGYIRGYVAGIRENGGQYTHAAVWAAMGFLSVGDGERGAELLRALSPLHRLPDREAMDRYRVEPYAFAGDVYSNPDHDGRGGWSFYTGAAGWYCTAVLEHLLGIRVSAGTLTLTPCVPESWPGFEAELTLPGHRTLRVIAHRGGGEKGVLTLNGERAENPLELPPGHSEIMYNL